MKIHGNISLTPIFLYLVLMVMISGAGATLTEYYGLNPQAGRIIMAVLALTTVLLGMTKFLQNVFCRSLTHAQEDAL